jgi:hypothetical protein
MEGIGQLVAFVLGVALLVGFFVLVIRVGAIQRGIANLEHQATEQTRYLSAMSANLSVAVRARESTREGQ